MTDEPTSDPDLIVPRVMADRAQRERAVVGREDLVSCIEALLFDDDPIGINFETNTDEYRAEAQTIVVRLPEATSEEDVARIIHEEFVRWFDPQMAGPAERYRAVAWS